MRLLTEALRRQLIDNARTQEPVKGTEEEIDFKPVVKLLMPYGIGIWLLTELDPDNPDIAFGLADLGYPELGYISISELEQLYSGPFPMVIREEGFVADKTISEYADIARVFGYIVA